MKQYHSVR